MCLVNFQVVIAVGHKVPSEALISLCPHQNPQSASLHDDDVEYSAAGVPLQVLTHSLTPAAAVVMLVRQFA